MGRCWPPVSNQKIKADRASEVCCRELAINESDMAVSTALTYSAREAAAVIGVSYWTTLRLIKRGKLRAIGAIRHKLIPKAELERFLRESLTGYDPALTRMPDQRNKYAD